MASSYHHFTLLYNVNVGYGAKSLSIHFVRESVVVWMRNKDKSIHAVVAQSAWARVFSGKG